VYRVQTDSQVREQLASLPIDVVLAYLEAVSVLELVPWNGTPVNPDNPEGALRTLPFGHGGLISYLILEAQQRVDILLVQWAGRNRRSGASECLRSAVLALTRG
jgi:hypothetical protein